MEVVTSLFISSAAPAAGAGAAAGGGITASGVLRGVFSGFEAFSVLAGGQADAGELEARADAERLRGQQELIEGKRRANDLSEELLQNIQRSQVVFAANGIDVSGGSARQAVLADLDQGEREVSNLREDARARDLARRANARNLLFSAEAERFGGAAGAGAVVGGALLRRANRG